MKIFLLTVICAAAGAASGVAQPAPPWSHGTNNPALRKGYVFQVDDVDNVPDLHGNPADARLVLFIGGNQFMVLPKLVAGFERLHPELRGHIFYETLPPGILRQQLANEGTITFGNLTLQVQADVYEAGAKVVSQMARQGQVELSIIYARNHLEIMVPAGNPKQIAGLRDLGKPGIHLSMPNPEWEGVARQIGASLRLAGGDELYRTVMETKVKRGSTDLTHIHHRETPMRIMSGRADAGVTWASEVRFQEKIGNPIAGVAIPKDQNVVASYAAGVLKSAPHSEAALAWVSYLRSPEAQAAYREYGFDIPDTDASAEGGR